MNIKQYIIGIFISLDELGNSITNGNAHETISARCGDEILKGNPCWLCSFFCNKVCKLLRIPTHCIDSYSAEKQMIQDAKGLPGEK